MRRRALAAGIIGGVALAIAALAGGLEASATSGTWVVTEDTVLTDDYHGDIIIGTDGVTLDCDGHAVTGPGALSGVAGITVWGRSATTVRNCVVQSFDSAFSIQDSDGGLYSDNAVSDVRQGFTLRRGVDNVFERNQVSGAFDYFAFGIFEDSHGTKVSSNEVTSSAIGILANDSDGLDVSGNYVHDNHGSGIEFRPTSGSVIKGNVSNDNGRGIVLAGGSAGNTVTMNTASGNHHGFNIQEASKNNAVSDNFASESKFNGFFIEAASTDNSLESNRSHNNFEFGFLDLTTGVLTSGTANEYLGNGCVRNGTAGDSPDGLCNESGSFSDDDGNTFELDIEWMAGEGITKGCNPPANDLFCPDDPVTRGQMAAFLVRALGYTDNGGGNLFIDDDGHTFENDIDKLGTAGVTKGCNPPTNDQYCPNDFVTRGQMAAFLVRALGYTDNGGGNLFIDDDGHTFENDIDKLGTAGVTKGCNPPTNDQYCPNDFVTRGQMAAFLRRALS